jgi:hypothetical protein
MRSKKLNLNYHLKELHALVLWNYKGREQPDEQQNI